MHSAPYSARPSESLSTKLSVPVITALIPERGSLSSSFKFNPAVSPTTNTPGVAAFSERAAISESFPSIRFSYGVNPLEITADGVSGDFPAFISSSVIFLIFFIPIRKTIVPSNPARYLRSGPLPSAVFPVTTVKAPAIPLWVTGIPAFSGTAMAELMPGITEKGIPQALRASISSPPRPKTKLSPPLSLTTFLPSMASRISISFISFWDMLCFPDLLPAYIFLQPSPGIFKSSLSIRSSKTSVPAFSSALTPAIVISPCPQPAPTSVTLPYRIIISLSMPDHLKPVSL